MTPDEQHRLKLTFSMINYIISFWCMCVVLSFWFLFKYDKSIPVFPFVFLRVRKGAGINFHHIYTEIIKSKFTFEDLPIPVTPVCLNCQGHFMVLINWL